VFKERLSTPSIRCIKSDKLRQTNFNEFLDDVVMKARKFLFNCLLCYVQPYSCALEGFFIGRDHYSGIFSIFF